MNKKKWLLHTMILSLLVSLWPAGGANAAAPAKLPAFPGAEGGGKYVTGGRGQAVYEVTTLEDYKSGETPIPGSLREAVSEGNRTVVFRVGGTIRLKEPLKIQGSNLTLAGQTAPGDGITVSDYTTNIEADNIIVRYMRFRLGDRVPSEDDAFGVRYHKNLIIDHCSFSWSVDEVVSLYDNQNTTVQWSISEESMLMTTHQKGRHGYGGIWGGNESSYLYNLIAHSVSRNPRFPTVISMYPDRMEASNNVIYNWGFFSTYGGGDGQYNLNNNYYKYGPSTYFNVRDRLFDEIAPESEMYLNGNIMDGSDSVTADNRKGVKLIKSPSSLLTAPIVIGDGFTPDPAETAYDKVLADSGATLPKRDEYDARIINDVKNRTGQHINSPIEIGGYPDYPKTVSAVVDQDHDGMDDAWEAQKGLSSADPEDRNGTGLSPEGYTNLEVYLQELIEAGKENGKHIGNPSVSITAPVNNTIAKAGGSLTVEAAADDADGIAKTELIVDGTKVAEDSTAPYSFQLNDLADGTHYLVVRAIDKDGLSTQSNNVAVHVNTEGPTAPWQAADIGSPGIPGHTQLGNTPGEVTVKSAGDIGGGIDNDPGTKDAFQFAYQTLEGNGEIIARVEHVTPTDDQAEAGVMIRESLDESSKMAFVSIPYVKNGKKGMLISRSQTGGAASRTETESFIATPYWVRLIRIGDQLKGLVSEDKKDWKLIGSVELPMKETVYAGLAADASDAPDEIQKYNTSHFSGAEIRDLPEDFPLAPESLQAVPGDKQAVLSWEAVSTAKSYSIKRSEVSGGPYTTVRTGVTGTSFTDTGLVAGKTYYYVVSAVNPSGESFNSAETSVVPAGPSEMIWLADDDFEQAELGQLPSGYTQSGPVPATETNKVIAAAVPSSSTGNPSAKAMQLYDTGTVSTKAVRNFAPQKGTLIVEADYMQEAVIGSAGLLQLQTPDGGKTPVSLEIRKPSTENTNVFVINNNSTYQKLVDGLPATNRWIHFRIEANVLTGQSKIFVDGQPAVTPVVDFNSGALSDTQQKGIGRIHFSTPGTGGGSPYWDNIKVYVEAAEAPHDLRVIEGNGAVELKWSAVDSAESYNVQRSEKSGGPYTPVASAVQGLSFIDDSVTNGKTYYYVVTANGSGEESGPSNEVKASPSESAVRPAAPAELRAVSRDSQLDFSWKAVEDVNSYTLKKAETAAGPFETVAEGIRETGYRLTGVPNGTTLYYTVTATNVAGESANSEPAEATAHKQLGTPAVSVREGDRQLTLNWSAVDGAEHYVVKRSASPEGPYVTVKAELADTEYTDADLTNGKPYYYKVTAANAQVSGLESAAAGARPYKDAGQPAIPEALRAEPGDGEVQLSWKPASGAANYQLVRSSAEEGPYTVIADRVSEPSYLDRGLENRQTYYYAVAARNAHGASLLSAPQQAVPGQVIVVDGSGAGDFATIQEAVAAVPDNSDQVTLIKVNNGIYKEKVLIPPGKNNITMIGESRDNTVLVYGDSAKTPGPDGSELGTSNSYTLKVQGTDFSMENMTVQNSAGRTAGQAVALYAEGDKGVYRNVKLMGYQDTLLTNRGRQYFADSFIEGTVDFIFGNSAVVFENNIINSKGPGYITAPSTEKDTPGYVFLNNTITADPEVQPGTVDLGRPWRDYGSSTYINNKLGAHIRPTGWHEWEEGRGKTARFSEYGSEGPGANSGARHNWTKQLTASEAAGFTLEATLGGNDGWNPKPYLGLIEQAPAAEIPVSSISVTGEGGRSSITGKKGSLQLSAAVAPLDATNRTVTWAVYEPDGVTPTNKAVISENGLLTARQNGTVRAVAAATDTSGVQGGMDVTISGQEDLPADLPNALLNGPSVVKQGEEFSYKVDLQNVTSSVYGPIYAVDLTVSFDPEVIEAVAARSLKDGFEVLGQKTNVLGRITITAAALGAQGAVAADGSLLEIVFRAKSQAGTAASPIAINSFMASNGQGEEFTILAANEAVIRVQPAQTAELAALIEQAQALLAGTAAGIEPGQVPASAKQQLEESIRAAAAELNSPAATPESISAAIAALNKAVQAFRDAILTAVKVRHITVTAADGKAEVAAGQTLQLKAAVDPAGAADPTVSWSVGSADGLASERAVISPTGLLTAKSPGSVTVTATANDGSGISGSLQVTIFTAEAKPPGSGSGSPSVPGSSPGTSGPKAPAADPAGTIKVEVNSQGAAVVNLSADQLQQAIKAAAGNKLQISIVPASGAKRVAVNLPARQLKEAADGLQTLELHLGLAKITVDMDLLERAIGSESRTLTLSAETVDGGKLPASTREKIGTSTVYDFEFSVDGTAVDRFGRGVRVEFAYPGNPGTRAHQVVVYRIDDQGNAQVVPNGRYDAASSSVKFRPVQFSLYAAGLASVSFNDISRVGWAKDSIEALAARSVIDGTGGGRFAPDAKVTRAQFLKMLMQALELSDERAVSTYTDVKPGTWYFSSAAAAQQLGLIQGKPDGSFGVNDEITREEMAVMAYRAAAYLKLELPSSGSGTRFADQSQISAYAADAVAAMQAGGIIEGVGKGRFSPKGLATRAQAAVIINRLFNLE